MRLLAGSQQRVVVGEEEGTGGVEKRKSETTRTPVVRVMKATRTRENKRMARVREKKARGSRVVGAPTTARKKVLVLGGNPERSVPSNASTFRRGDVQTRKFVPSKVAYNHYKEYHEGTCDDDTEFEQCAEENPVVNDLVDNNMCSWEGQGRIQY